MNLVKFLKVFVHRALRNPRIVILALIIALTIAAPALGWPVQPLDPGDGSSGGGSDGPGTPDPHPVPL